MIEGAPKLIDFLGDAAAEHFESLKVLLDAAGLDYTVNPRLVRGLDYYNRSVFEFVSSDIGAQSTIAGGGRYDGLFEQLGGKPTPACGFGMGIERVLLTLEAAKRHRAAACRCIHRARGRKCRSGRVEDFGEISRRRTRRGAGRGRKLQVPDEEGRRERRALRGDRGRGRGRCRARSR